MRSDELLCALPRSRPTCPPPPYFFAPPFCFPHFDVRVPSPLAHREVTDGPLPLPSLSNLVGDLRFFVSPPHLAKYVKHR